MGPDKVHFEPGRGRSSSPPVDADRDRQRGQALLAGGPERLSADLKRVLEKRGFSIDRAARGRDALRRVDDEDFDVVLLHFELPDLDPIALCQRMTDNHPDVPVMVLIEKPTLDSSIAALRAGAYDYLSWPAPVESLAMSLDRAVQHRRLQREVRRLRRRLRVGKRYDSIIGESPAMVAVFDTLDRVLDSQASVLITGETGTGKEVVARALHRRGARRDGPFVAINCAAIPENLLESELFGHVKGAFTDARAARKGLFVQATGGTLFLDEIGEMPAALQVKLLRALQDRRVRPVGGSEEVPFDARILAATNRDLEQLVEEGRFRRDLYYRLNVIHVDLPPLRARGGDVLLLAQHFLERAVGHAGKEILGLSPAAARKLLEYQWPGNIRELENCIERAVAYTRGGEITVGDLPSRVASYRSTPAVEAAPGSDELVPLRTVEQRHIQRVLDAVGGNKAAAARILGIERKTLYRKLEG